MTALLQTTPPVIITTATTAPPVGAGARPPGRGVLTLLCAVQFLVMVDTAVLNVALPSLGAALGAGAGGLGRVVDAYVVAFAGLLLLGGRLADRAGPRRVLLAGLGVFTAAALAGGLSPSVGALVAARAAQGAGAALAVPAALSLLTSTARDAAARHRAMAAWTAVAGAGAAAGVVLGGVLTAVADWRAIFLVQVPLGLAVGLGLARRTPRDTPWAGRPRVGAVSPLLVVAGLALLVVGLLETGTGSRRTGLLALAGAAALLVLAARADARSDDPLVPAGLRHRRSAAVCALAALLGAAGLSTVFGLTVHLQLELGWSPVRTGLALLALALPLVALTPLARRLLAGHPPAHVLALGLAVAAGGRALLALPAGGAGSAGEAAALLAGLVLVGAGTAVALVPLGVLAVQGAGRSAGLAGAAFTSALQTGGALGVALAAPLAAASGARPVFLLGALLRAGGPLLVRASARVDPPSGRRAT